MKMESIIPKILPFLGVYFRIGVKVPFLRQTIFFTNGAVGRLIPKLAFLGFRKGKSYENAIWNWELYLKLVGCAYEVQENDQKESIYILRQCPVGNCRRDHTDVCDATMTLDHNVVKTIGAKLILEKTIPVDGICVLRIARAG